MHERIVVGPIATNCWITPLEHETVTGNNHYKPCAVIDPGADPEAIIARLERKKLRVLYILLTHGHFDHLAALYELIEYSKSTGDEAIVAVHTADAAYLGPAAKEHHIRDFKLVGAEAYVEMLWNPIPAATRLLQDGDRIGPFTILHLPGHSPGSVAFYNEQKKVLYSGDTLFSGGVGRTDLPGGDSRELLNSLQRLLSMDGQIQVYPGHGNSTCISAER